MIKVSEFQLSALSPESLCNLQTKMEFKKKSLKNKDRHRDRCLTVPHPHTSTLYNYKSTGFLPTHRIHIYPLNLWPELDNKSVHTFQGKIHSQSRKMSFLYLAFRALIVIT